MPPTINYKFGDIILVPFPFTDQTASKQRPSVVVSSSAYHREQPDIIFMAVTSQVRVLAKIGEVGIHSWQEAGLIKPSVFKPILATIDKKLILKKLGELSQEDQYALQQSLAMILGK